MNRASIASVAVVVSLGLSLLLSACADQVGSKDFEEVTVSTDCEFDHVCPGQWTGVLRHVVVDHKLVKVDSNGKQKRYTTYFGVGVAGYDPHPDPDRPYYNVVEKTAFPFDEPTPIATEEWHDLRREVFRYMYFTAHQFHYWVECGPGPVKIAPPDLLGEPVPASNMPWRLGRSSYFYTAEQVQQDTAVVIDSAMVVVPESGLWLLK